MSGGTIDVAIKLGRVLVQTCSAFKHADREVDQHILRVELCWKQTSLQLEFLQRIWSELDEQHQRLQEETTLVLTSLLSEADSRLNSISKQDDNPSPNPTGDNSKRTKKVAYALLKKHLVQLISRIDEWQPRFDPSWYLVLRVASDHIDKELQNAATNQRDMKVAAHIRDSLRIEPKEDVRLSLSKAAVEAGQVENIPFSGAQVMYEKKTNRYFILDVLKCSTTEEIRARVKPIRELARKLGNVDPSRFALLSCVGYVPDLQSNQLTLVFKKPEHTGEPQTLRAILLAEARSHSLSDRFRLAVQLATAVCSIHTLGFVHKSIRPENILMMQSHESSIGSGYLVGFEHARLEDGRTNFVGDADWEKNLYRHPQRQGLSLGDPYVMQHDIYSLGVCLLEIGLWTSFVLYEHPGYHPEKPEGYGFGAAQATVEFDVAEAVKGELLTLATERLPGQMGSKYARVVQTCLSCLDESCEDFGDESEFQDEDGVLVAVRYIEKVLIQLSNISV